jgi:polysaccharide deacetylase family protein (PEP-CTERM system associated)
MGAIVLTVDVEDYFHVSGFASCIRPDQWDGYPLRVEASTDRLLSLFDRCNVRGTFFVLGWLADRTPQLIHRIAKAGHEIASHGYWHQLVYDQTPEQFREDLRRSRQAIGEACGVSVMAYRAPSFSITARSLWALDVLLEEGFQVDSSVFPVRHDRYGIPGARPDLHLLETQVGPIIEFPPSFGTVAGRRIPIGGGYFRMFPLAVSRRAIAAVNRQGRPAMFYIHPWEVDPDQPRIGGVPLRNRFRHYVNLRRTARRLERLVEHARCMTLGEACGSLLIQQEELASIPASGVTAARSDKSFHTNHSPGIGLKYPPASGGRQSPVS